MPVPNSRGLILFFTGLPGAGKSTLAQALASRLAELGRTVTLLDGDQVRALLSSGLGYSRADRDLNVRRIGYVAAEIARHGGIAICAQIAPYAAARAEARRRGAEAGPVRAGARRDAARSVRAARPQGAVREGARRPAARLHRVSDPYEPPHDAEVTIDTQDCTPREAANAILGQLRREGVLD